MKVVGGVDCHKHSHAIVFIDQVGTVLRELEITTSSEGYHQAIRAASELGEVTWGLEGTGSYGRAFADALLATGSVVFEVPARLTKRHRRHASQVGKSDLRDARAIAEAVLREADRLPRFTTFDDQEAMRLRRDQRDRLVRERTQAVNRLRYAALRLELASLPDKLTSTAAVRGICLRAERLRGRSASGDALIDDIVVAAEAMARCNEHIKRIEAILRPLVSRLAPELLALHGVSHVVAAGLVGHAGDMRNCRSADAFAMRSATAPVSWSSGRSVNVRVNQGGNRQLNRSLHQIAVVQIRAKGHAGQIYYARRRSEGLAHRAALRALKRRLATVVYYRLVMTQHRLESAASEQPAA